MKSIFVGEIIFYLSKISFSRETRWRREMAAEIFEVIDCSREQAGSRPPRLWRALLGDLI
ncbi:hypothetical protein [endosymbiont of Tevnia jerichonana]|uniref:hypothetical protein n=1 Tax=endosymbiont of Tevnia jerichonana TaxID=94785 RepID=UPI0011104978|nr:hypothetical protein [endosymbiont of Tevnia jerichonana]